MSDEDEKARQALKKLEETLIEEIWQEVQLPAIRLLVDEWVKTRQDNHR